MTKHRWCVLKAVPMMERMTLAALQKLEIVAHFPVETYRPLNHWRRRTRPLIPGYIFADLPDDEALDLARSYRGVREIMCNADGRPIELDPLVIGALVLFEAWRAFDMTWKAPMSKAAKRKGRKPTMREVRWEQGQRVRVKEGRGPFEGFVGDVLRTDRDKRVTLVLSIFGRETDVEIDDDAVESVTQERDEAA